MGTADPGRAKERTQIDKLRQALDDLPKDARSQDDQFWKDSVSETSHGPSDRLRVEIEVASEGSKHAARLEHLAERVLDAFYDRGGQGARPLVVHIHPSGAPSCGVAVYRPKELNTLLNANYLRLEFNRRSHWTALQAVINLVQGHARAMWRVIASVISTAPLSAREALLQRVLGPATVLAGFREQLAVLASPPLATLSITDGGSTPVGHVGAGRYVVRYTPREPLAMIAQGQTLMTADGLRHRFAELDPIFQRQSLTSSDLARLHTIGHTLGGEVIAGVTEGLEKDFDDTAKGAMHLQLQLRRELMRYPWELMQDREGLLADRYALARQVYVPEGLVRSRPRVRRKRLRPLIIAAPTTAGGDATLAAAYREGEEVSKKFASLRDQLGDVIDFDPARDAFIGKHVDVDGVKELLGSGEYDIVHFSGHGTFNEGAPHLSGWVLSNSTLVVEEIENTLRWSRNPPWLVFANACKSAAEPANYQGAIHGLASAFVMNGVSAYLGALWNIADLVGYLVAVEFYEALLLGRATLGQALLIARNKVKAISPPTVKVGGELEEVEVETLLALTSYGFALFGDPTAKALEQIRTESAERSGTPVSPLAR